MKTFLKIQEKFNYHKQKDIGLAGEAKVVNWLKINMGQYVIKEPEFIQDFSGIDILISKEGKSYGLQIKNDVRSIQTGNFFIETTQRYNNDGWLYENSCKYLILLSGDTGYVLKFADLQQYIESTKSKLRLVKGGNYASGYLVSKKEIEKISIKQLAL